MGLEPIRNLRYSACRRFIATAEPEQQREMILIKLQYRWITCVNAANKRLSQMIQLTASVDDA